MDAKVKAYLERVEGRENDPYSDSKGLLTVGVGHLLQRRYSDAEIDEFFEQDTSQALALCENLSYWHNLTPARQCVVLSLVYNVGFAGFQEFAKFRAALAHGDYFTAARELVDSKRSREDIGKERSDTEEQMMESGEWPKWL